MRLTRLISERRSIEYFESNSISFEPNEIFSKDMIIYKRGEQHRNALRLAVCLSFRPRNEYSNFERAKIVFLAGNFFLSSEFDLIDIHVGTKTYINLKNFV